jgi:Uma2 family endonuclease
MALSFQEREVRLLTVDEVMVMAEAGIFDSGPRVELLEGVLTTMSPQHPPHASTVMLLTRWLAPLMVAGTYDVRVQLPLLVGSAYSLPEPDVAVVPVSGDRREHPLGAPLVIEVSDASLRVDTRVKPDLYAQAGVPDYWVVDVQARCVRVFRDPHPTGYARTDIARNGTLEPLEITTEPLDLAALFDGLEPR